MNPKLQPRRYERVSVAVAAQFNILLPEATFQPLNFPCIIRDLSERGAMVEVDLDTETYRMLLQKTRFCRVNFPAGNDIPERVVGRSVWIQPEGKGETRTFKIGLFFEDCPAVIVEQLRSFVHRLKLQQESENAVS
ncbi:MAG: PilZ domain-containing protein [Candidatus Sumerlaeaceae bacterium]